VGIGPLEDLLIRRESADFTRGIGLALAQASY
jgi:hypothetical protein